MQNLLATQPLEFARTPHPSPRGEDDLSAILKAPGFGEVFTDHMVSIHWKGDWHRAKVEPYGPIQLDPAAAVLHYGQEIFEGLKAYRHEDGSIWTFRPEANAARFQHSARRMALPELPTDVFIESIRQLVTVDARWVPSGGETSLYLRPFMFAAEAFLGVRSARKAYYYLIASPAGPYFKSGPAPVRIWLSTDHARAAKGGTGTAKTGGNYAASLLPQEEAYAQGCQQVLFLDAEHGRYLEELGGMNIVLVTADGTLLTPDSDTILAGITRDSILQLAADRGHRIERRPVSLEEWREGAASGEIVEAFACGTAAVLTPIGLLKSAEFMIGSDDAAPGELSMALRQELTDIQYGRAEDRHGWLTRLA